MAVMTTITKKRICAHETPYCARGAGTGAAGMVRGLWNLLHVRNVSVFFRQGVWMEGWSAQRAEVEI